jgi:hypothetical protein
MNSVNRRWDSISHTDFVGREIICWGVSPWGKFYPGPFFPGERLCAGKIYATSPSLQNMLQNVQSSTTCVIFQNRSHAYFHRVRYNCAKFGESQSLCVGRVYHTTSILSNQITNQVHVIFSKKFEHFQKSHAHFQCSNFREQHKGVREIDYSYNLKTTYSFPKVHASILKINVKVT